VDQARHAKALCCLPNSAGAFDVNGAIGLCGCLGENADQVDDGIRSGDRSSNAHIVKYIALDYLRALAGSAAFLTWPG
jgi:hypothetical protein